MDFQLSSDQKMLRDTVRSFTKQRSGIDRFRELREADRPDATFDPAMWAHLGELGWPSIPFGEDVGGFGGTFFDVAIVLEELGKTLVPEPLIPSLVAGLAIYEAGDAAAHERWLGPMLEGQAVLALAHEERTTRFESRPRETTAEADGDGWRLRGRKAFVHAGHVAHQLVVTARVDEETALFVVERDAAGVEIAPVRTLDAHGAASVTLDARLDGSARLRGGNAGDVLDRALDYGAAATCAESVGVGQAVLDMTVAHLKEREQFGRPIGVFQALQHAAVDMFVQLELMKSMSALAAGSVAAENASERRSSVSAAKAHIARSGRALTQASIQLHGGIGITEEHDVGLYLKRMHALSVMFGDADHHTRRFSAQPGWAE